jgi:hypothetical protein
MAIPAPFTSAVIKMCSDDSRLGDLQQAFQARRPYKLDNATRHELARLIWIHRRWMEAVGFVDMVSRVPDAAVVTSLIETWDAEQPAGVVTAYLDWSDPVYVLTLDGLNETTYA